MGLRKVSPHEHRTWRQLLSLCGCVLFGRFVPVGPSHVHREQRFYWGFFHPWNIHNVSLEFIPWYPEVIWCLWWALYLSGCTGLSVPSHVASSQNKNLNSSETAWNVVDLKVSRRVGIVKKIRGGVCRDGKPCSLTQLGCKCLSFPAVVNWYYSLVIEGMPLRGWSGYSCRLCWGLF